MSNPTYFIAEVEIQNPAALQPYLDAVGATMVPFAPQMLINGDAITPLEGEAPRGKIVIIRFDSKEAALGWYTSPAYQAIIAHRINATTSRTYLVEGL